MAQLSPYFIAIIAGWLIAQGLKYLIVSLKTHNFDHIRQLYLSGNMPSAHSTSVMALTTIIGLSDGIASGLFGLAALFAAIVMYDAMMVRRSSGEQGHALQQLIREVKSDIPLPRAAKGHSPLEVLAGAVLGGVIGLVVFLATR